MALPGFLRRLFGGAPRGPGWTILDPRPVRAAHPYTFFVPSEDEIAALQPGDLVKMTFEGPEGGERMWVIFGGRDSAGCFGTLDNQPLSIPGLGLGDQIRFQDFNIISVMETRFPNPDALERLAFTRCRVDPAVLAEGGVIMRAERAAPEDVEGVHSPDSGWHFYGSLDGGPPRDKMQFLALGVVLNKDDSILPMLDAPAGTLARRDGDNGHLTLQRPD